MFLAVNQGIIDSILQIAFNSQGLIKVPINGILLLDIVRSEIKFQSFSEKELAAVMDYSWLGDADYTTSIPSKKSEIVWSFVFVYHRYITS